MTDPTQIPYDTRPQFVIIGKHADGSGQSEQAYGPYPEDIAQRVAAELDGGMWQSMIWHAVPMMLTPWERRYGTD